MKVDNLYEHADEGFYCKIAEGVMKDPATGDWLPSVSYTGATGEGAGLVLTTTEERWNERFSPVAEYTGDDEAVLAMIRRTNPSDFDILDVVSSWDESETQITAELLELAIVAVALAGKISDEMLPEVRHTSMISGDFDDSSVNVEIVVKPAHLQHVLQNYEIERRPTDEGYSFVVRK